jgi:integrase
MDDRGDFPGLRAYDDRERVLAKQLAQVIDKYLIPLSGKFQCHNIHTEQLREFSKKRVELMGKVPTTSTSVTHNTVLNYVFRKALSLNYIQYLPRLISNDGDSTKKRRSYFNDTELRQLNNEMGQWVKTTEALHKVKGGRNGIDTLSDTSYDIRMMLRDIVLILVNTGIRAGEELLNLEWNNLDIVEQDGMESICFSLTHTKTGTQRVVIGYEPIRTNEDERYGCWMPLQRIAERFPKLDKMNWDNPL